MLRVYAEKYAVSATSEGGQIIRGPLSDDESAGVTVGSATAVEIVLDIAHNPGAISALMRRVQREYPTRSVRLVSWSVRLSHGEYMYMCIVICVCVLYLRIFIMR